MVKKIILASPRGYCAGVSRAIDIVEKALEKFGKPIYVRHAIVHNAHVVKELEKKGVIFVESLDEVPKGSKVIFSAHGSPPALKEKAAEMGILPIDAVCPLVTKVHVEARRFHRNGYDIIYIGHKGHQEAVGVTAISPMHLVENVEDVKQLALNNEKIVILTQTTLSIDDMREIMGEILARYPQAEAPPKEDICYATTNRQGAVKEMAQQAELILVVGSPTSSNSVRLMETAKYSGTESYLIPDEKGIEEEWLENIETLGITSGASVPDYLVEGVITAIRKKNTSCTIQTLDHVTEKVTFIMPPGLE
ncbi:4-hydroxy-3-methylbut-2-enyl diphosphate reductase [Candidatus Woesearchaeota archaeon]|nr:4-hydroxy-3-methylbut-2-enyl diphosphate reductase [Candidatus Woesearchaeota archaeon]